MIITSYNSSELYGDLGRFFNIASRLYSEKYSTVMDAKGYLECMIDALYLLDADHKRYNEFFGDFGYKTPKHLTEPSSSFISSICTYLFFSGIKYKKQVVIFFPETVIKYFAEANNLIIKIPKTNRITFKNHYEDGEKELINEGYKQLVSEYKRNMSDSTYEYLIYAARLYNELIYMCYPGGNCKYKTEEAMALSLFISLFKYTKSTDENEIQNKVIKFCSQNEITGNSLLKKLGVSNFFDSSYDPVALLIKYFKDLKGSDISILKIFKAVFIDSKDAQKIVQNLLLQYYRSYGNFSFDELYKYISNGEELKPANKEVKPHIREVTKPIQTPKVSETRKEEISESNISYLKKDKNILRLFTTAYILLQNMEKNKNSINLVKNDEELKLLSIFLAFFAVDNKDYYDKEFQVIDLFNSAGISLEYILIRINYNIDNIDFIDNIDVINVYDKYASIINNLRNRPLNVKTENEMFLIARLVFRENRDLIRQIINNDDIFNSVNCGILNVERQEFNVPLENLPHMVEILRRSRPEVNNSDMESIKEYVESANKQLDSLFDNILNNFNTSSTNVIQMHDELINICQKYISERTGILSSVRKKTVNINEVIEFITKFIDALNKQCSDISILLNVTHGLSEELVYYNNLSSDAQIDISMSEFDDAREKYRVEALAYDKHNAITDNSDKVDSLIAKMNEIILGNSALINFLKDVKSNLGLYSFDGNVLSSDKSKNREQILMEVQSIVDMLNNPNTIRTQKKTF